MTKEQQYKKEIESLIDWLEASKGDMVGETATNVLFTIKHLKKVINN